MPTPAIIGAPSPRRLGDGSWLVHCVSQPRLRPLHLLCAPLCASILRLGGGSWLVHCVSQPRPAPFASWVLPLVLPSFGSGAGRGWHAARSNHASAPFASWVLPNLAATIPTTTSLKRRAPSRRGRRFGFRDVEKSPYPLAVVSGSLAIIRSGMSEPSVVGLARAWAVARWWGPSWWRGCAAAITPDPTTPDTIATAGAFSNRRSHPTRQPLL